MRASWLFHNYRSHSVRKLLDTRVFAHRDLQIDIAGTTLIAPPGIALRCYAYCSLLSLNVAALISLMLPPQGRFLDGGAFAGQHIQTALRASHAGTVLAFEPHPGNRNLITQAMASSGLREGWLLRPEALGGQNGNANFQMTPEPSLSSITDERSPSSISVRVLSLREVVDEFRPHVVKLDLEGSEHDAITSLVDSRERPAIVVEANHNLAGIAQDLGYRMYTMAQLFPSLSRFSNVSNDVLLTTECFSESARRHLNVLARNLLDLPVVKPV